MDLMAMLWDLFFYAFGVLIGFLWGRKPRISASDMEFIASRPITGGQLQQKRMGICMVCGKTIILTGPRRSEAYVHKKCLEGNF